MLLRFIFLLAAHWFADFVLQTHWQASNKSKRLDALAAHVLVYTAVLFIATLLIFAPEPSIFVFVVVNGAAHFATDFCTSRWSSRLYAKQDWHNFFVVIGFDQLIHQVTLAGTMWLIFSRA